MGVAAAVEDHIDHEGRRPAVVAGQGDRLLGAERSAVPLAHEVHHGARLELEHADIGAAANASLTATAGLAIGEPADQRVPAHLDGDGARLGGRIGSGIRGGRRSGGKRDGRQISKQRRGRNRGVTNVQRRHERPVPDTMRL